MRTTSTKDHEMVIIAKIADDVRRDFPMNMKILQRSVRALRFSLSLLEKGEKALRDRRLRIERGADMLKPSVKEAIGVVDEMIQKLRSRKVKCEEQLTSMSGKLQALEKLSKEQWRNNAVVGVDGTRLLEQASSMADKSRHIIDGVFLKDDQTDVMKENGTSRAAGRVHEDGRITSHELLNLFSLVRI